jgi:hypothetical protein
MNCRKAKAKLALYAGGDLPENEVPLLLAHVKQCADCAAELEALKHSLALVGEIAEADGPDPLPADFDWQVQQAVETSGRLQPRRTGFTARLIQWRPQISLGGITLAALLALFVAWDAWERVDESAQGPSGVSPPVPETAGQTEVNWDELKVNIASCMEGPYRLDGWEVPRQAGVYAIMHKPDPENKPDVYVIDYCGESAKLSSYRGYPWLEQRTKRMVARAGYEENVYIAVCLLDESSRQDRRRMEKALIKEYKPYFNVRRGV